MAFLGAPSSDAYGNANGSHGKANCGSLGYAKVDAEFADQVVIITDNLVPYPNTPISIPQNQMDYVVEVESIGDPNGIAKGATRITTNPKELLIAEYANKVITASPYYKEGFSFQSGTGGSALEIDIDFNVNVMTGSDGIIRGASGGHSDASAGAKLSLVLTPLIRGRIPTIVEKVNTIITPGESIDVVVTEIGIAVNPRRKDLVDAFRNLGIAQFTLEELKEKAYAIVGRPDAIDYEEKVVALIEYRDGSLIDVVRKVKA